MRRGQDSLILDASFWIVTKFEPQPHPLVQKKATGSHAQDYSQILNMTNPTHWQEGCVRKWGTPKSWLISYGKWWLTDWHRQTIGFEGDSASLDLVAGWQLLALWQNNTCNSQVAEGQWCVTLDGNYTVLKTDRIATYFDPAIRSFDSSIRDVGSAEGILNFPLFGW